MDKIGANMRFQKFEEYIKTRTVSEFSNQPALQADRRRLVFNNTFKNHDPKEVEQTIIGSGRWKSVQEFINDPDESKYAKLKFPGAGNWVR